MTIVNAAADDDDCDVMTVEVVMITQVISSKYRFLFVVTCIKIDVWRPRDTNQGLHLEWHSELFYSCSSNAGYIQ